MSKIYSVLGKKKALALIIVLTLAIVGVIGAASADNLSPGQIAASKTAQADTNGDYDVSINIVSAGFEESQDSDKKDVILILDISTSMNYDMYDNPTNTVSDRRITAAKAAANNFVDLLFPEGSTTNRMAIVTFGSSAATVNIGGVAGFSNNPAAIKTAINNITVPSNNGTNPQAGYIRARTLLGQARNDADTAVIMLSDGQPTYSISNSYWSNTGSTFYREDRAINANLGTTNTGSGNSFTQRHADRTIIEANKLRALGAKIYTVAFTNQTGTSLNRINATMGSGYNGSAYKFNNDSNISYSYDGRTYSLSKPYTAQFSNTSMFGTVRTDGYLVTGFNDFKVAYAAMAVNAGNAGQLNSVFETFADAIMHSVVAKNGVLVDRIPEYFEVDLNSLPAGASYDAATRTITFTLGNIDASRSLNYKVKPVAGYNGLGYTNANTVLTFNPLAENPYYGNSTAQKSIDILTVAARQDEGVVNSRFAGSDDVYNNADRNQPFVVNAANSTLSNDATKSLHYVNRTAAAGYELVPNSNGIYIKRNVPAKAYISTNPQYGTVSLNADGTFTYTYNLTANPYNHSITSDSFYYYLADEDDFTGTKSEPIKVTIYFKELVDVTVKYLQTSAGNPLIPNYSPNPQTIIKQVDDKVSYSADLSSPDTITTTDGLWIYNSSSPNLKLGDYTVLPTSGGTNPNVLNLYYDKGYGLSVDVQHYLENGDNPLTFNTTPEDTDTITDGIYGQVINYTAKTYAGYELDASLTNLNGNAVNGGGQPIFSLVNNPIKLYYKAKTLTTTIVHYDVTGKTANGDGSYNVTAADKMSTADITLTGKIYNTFNPEDKINKNIAGYNFVDIFGAGIFTTGGHTIHAYYERPAVNAVIRYVEEDGSSYVDLDPDQNVDINGNLGDTFYANTIVIKTFPGFTHKTTVIPAGGPFATNPGQDILVVYERVSASVVVEYRDIANPEGLLKSEVLPTSGNGKFGDSVTFSTANFSVGSILYTYDSVKAHGYKTSAFNQLYLAQKPDGSYRTEDEHVVVWMKTIPATITVHFYEEGHTTPLTPDATLTGIVGGSYGTALAALEATEIDGFIYKSTVNDSTGRVFLTVSDQDIIIYYNRNEGTISWEHKYLDGTLVNTGSNGSQSGAYLSTLNISKLTDSSYKYVGFSVNPYASGTLVSDGTAALTATYGTGNYEITLWYVKTAAPGEGTINVEYREEGTNLELIPFIPHSGAYSYQRVVSQVQTGEENVLDGEGNVIGTKPVFDITYETVPAESFALTTATDSAIANITGFTQTGATLNGDDAPDTLDFTAATQTIIVWYTRDSSAITLKYLWKDGEGIDVEIAADFTLTGLFNKAYDTSGKIPAEIIKDGVRYTGGVLPSPAPFVGKFPLGTNNVIKIYYTKVATVEIPIKYYISGTTTPVFPDDPSAPNSISGQVGDTLTLGSHPSVANYTPSGDVSNPYGSSFPESVGSPIIYYYEPVSYTVNIKYVEYMGFFKPYQSLNGQYGFNDYSITDSFGADYTVLKPNPAGFTFKYIVDKNGGKIGANNKDVYVVYCRKADCKVTVKYYDVTNGTNGTKVLLGSVRFKGGKYDYPFSSVKGYSKSLNKTFPHYTKVGVSENADGRFCVGSNVVEVYYVKDTINMTLYFREKGEGNTPLNDTDLKAPHTFSGHYGESYSLDGSVIPTQIDGFELVVPGNLPLSGVFPGEDGVLYALYTRNDVSLIVHYKHLGTGDTIKADTIIHGKYGDTYNVDTSKFGKYVYHSIDNPNDPNSTTGILTFGQVGEEEYQGMEDITVWYTRKSSPPDPKPTPEPEEEEEIVFEEEPPYEPVIPEPEEEVVEEEEIPQGTIPAAGGTLTYLLSALGVIIVVGGGLMLRKARSQK